MNKEMGISLNASWEPPVWNCDNRLILGYKVVVKDLRIGQQVESITIQGRNSTEITLHNLHYLRNFSVSVSAFTARGIGPVSHAFSSTFESGKLRK